MKKRNDFCLGFVMSPAPALTDAFIRTPEDARKVCEEQAGYGQECFTVLCLNARNRLIAGGIISIGIQDSALVHSREVFRKAIQSEACAIVVTHNHPTGDPTPSAEDVKLTKQLIEAGKIIGIKVLDHVILGRMTETQKGYCSMREAGVVEFE